MTSTTTATWTGSSPRSIGIRFGNRLYRNLGAGVFEDATVEPVDDGGWGWGACAADFDNDTYIDIVHVNGWVVNMGKDYRNIPVRFFTTTGRTT